MYHPIIPHAHLDLYHLVAATGGWVAFGPADWVHSMWSYSGPGGDKKELYYLMALKVIPKPLALLPLKNKKYIIISCMFTGIKQKLF